MQTCCRAYCVYVCVCRPVCLSFSLSLPSVSLSHYPVCVSILVGCHARLFVFGSSGPGPSPTLTFHTTGGWCLPCRSTTANLLTGNAPIFWPVTLWCTSQTLKPKKSPLLLWSVRSPVPLDNPVVLLSVLWTGARKAPLVHTLLDCTWGQSCVRGDCRNHCVCVVHSSGP